jgi:hypothetical protein
LAEGSTGILGSAAQRKIVQNSDPSHRDNKIKEPPGFRQGASNNHTTCCQRCNEAGHSTQFCAVDKLSLSAIKPLSEQNLNEASNKRNTTSETSNLVATEKTTCRSADQSEQILKCGAYQSSMQNYHSDGSHQVFSSGDEQIASTVPELNYIWQYEYSSLSISFMQLFTYFAFYIALVNSSMCYHQFTILRRHFC